MRGIVVFVTLLICLPGVNFAPLKIRMKDLEKWLVPRPVDERMIKIGFVDLDFTDMNFESRFLKVYNNVIDFINGNVKPARHFRMIFNRNIMTCISEVIFPARYKENAVEGNTVLYQMQCLIQRRIYMDLTLDNPRTQQCWQKLDSAIYSTSSVSEIYYETEDQVLSANCKLFFDKWYPDVKWDMLPAWEISLNPSQFLQKKRLPETSNKIHQESNFENDARQFCACTYDKISFLQDATTRSCYQKTLDSNMHSFLKDFQWKFSREYDRLMDKYTTASRTSSARTFEFKNDEKELSDSDNRKTRVKKDFDSISVPETQDESVAYQRKAIIFVGVIIFMGCVILAAIITAIVLCCKDFRKFYRDDPEPLEQDFKTIEDNLKKGKSNVKFIKSKPLQKGRKKTTHKMKSMSDVTLPIADDLKPLPDENDPLIRTSFNNPSKPSTPKKKK